MIPNIPRGALLRVATFVLACAAPTRHSLADVHVVDVYGTGDFTAVQPAIDAADDGDTIYIRGGGYPAGFSVDDKTLWILGIGPGAFPARINDTVEVKNLSAGKFVVLCSIHVMGTGLPTGSPLTAPTGLILSNNAGHVRAQACKFYGGGGAPNGRGGSAVAISNSTSVAFQGCEIYGGTGHIPCGSPSCDAPYESGGDGISTSASQLALYDCTVSGGRGTMTATLARAGDGGHAIDVTSGGLFASGCEIYGGNGGYADGHNDPTGGNGGHGVRVPSGAADLLQNVVVAGQPGPAQFGVDGNAGLQTQGPGAIHFLPGLARLASAHTSTQSNHIAVSLTGQPGDRVYVPTSLAPGWRYVPVQLGVWLLATPVRFDYVPVATMYAYDQLVLIPAPEIASGESVRHVFAQSFFRPAGTNLMVPGSPLHFTVRK